MVDYEFLGVVYDSVRENTNDYEFLGVVYDSVRENTNDYMFKPLWRDYKRLVKNTKKHNLYDFTIWVVNKGFVDAFVWDYKTDYF